MPITTDKVIVENGTDFTFVCRKIPFAISCTSDLPHGDTNLIDLELVNKMRIPLRNIRVTRMSLLGHDVRAVGRIKQTIQCVHNGRIQGTVHLEGKVVRDLSSIFNVDCLASSKTYERLAGRKPPEPPDDGYDSHEDVENLDGPPEDEEGMKEEDVDDNEDLEATISEKVPPDPNKSDPPDEKLNSFGDYRDLDDFLANAPWSRECVPRASLLNDPLRRLDYRPPVNSDGEDNDAEDDILAAAHGYPDTRYTTADLATLGPLGPTDRRIIASMQDDQDDGDDRFHAQFGMKSHAPHLYDRGTAQDEDKPQAKHGNHKLQLRGPRSRRKVTQDEDEYEFTADELAIMHGYPAGPPRRGRRM